MHMRYLHSCAGVAAHSWCILQDSGSPEVPDVLTSFPLLPGGSAWCQRTLVDGCVQARYHCLNCFIQKGGHQVPRHMLWGGLEHTPYSQQHLLIKWIWDSNEETPHFTQLPVKQLCHFLNLQTGIFRTLLFSLLPSYMHAPSFSLCLEDNLWSLKQWNYASVNSRYEPK